MFSLVKAYVDTDANIDLDFPAALLSMRAQCLREKKQRNISSRLISSHLISSHPISSRVNRGATEPAAASASMLPTPGITPDRVRVKSWRRKSYWCSGQTTHNHVQGWWRQVWWLAFLDMGEHAVMETWIKEGEAEFVPGPETVQGGEEERDRASDRGASEPAEA